MPLFRHAASILTACVVLTAGTVGPVLARDIEVDVMSVDSTAVTFGVGMADRATEKITRSLHDGFPIQVTYQIELWQARARWFDRLVTADVFGYLLRLDPWSDEYELASDDLPERIFASEDELVSWLADHGPLEITTGERLPESREFYLAVRAAIAPLTEEQVSAVERWLRGKSEDGPGMTGVFFDFALRMSGLGGLEVTARSDKFRPATAGSH